MERLTIITQDHLVQEASTARRALTTPLTLARTGITMLMATALTNLESMIDWASTRRLDKVRIFKTKMERVILQRFYL